MGAEGSKRKSHVDELHEGVVLPDADGVRQQWEKEQAAAGRAAAAEEEDTTCRPS